jgi:hypothetical protein
MLSRSIDDISNGPFKAGAGRLRNTYTDPTGLPVPMGDAGVNADSTCGTCATNRIESDPCFRFASEGRADHGIAIDEQAAHELAGSNGLLPIAAHCACNLRGSMRYAAPEAESFHDRTIAEIGMSIRLRKGLEKAPVRRIRWRCEPSIAGPGHLHTTNEPVAADRRHDG